MAKSVPMPSCLRQNSCLCLSSMRDSPDCLTDSSNGVLFSVFDGEFFYFKKSVFMPTFPAKTISVDNNEKTLSKSLRAV